MSVQRVAMALMRHGEYDESPDSVEWLKVDTAAVAQAAEHGPAAVVAALIDTGFCFDPPDTDEYQRAAAVAREIAATRGES